MVALYLPVTPEDVGNHVRGLNADLGARVHPRRTDDAIKTSIRSGQADPRVPLERLLEVLLSLVEVCCHDAGAVLGAADVVNALKKPPESDLVW